jgi:competence protein ComEC
MTLSTAWLIGIAAARYVNPPPALIGLLAVLPPAALLLSRADSKLRRIVACSFLLLLGSLRYTLSLPDLVNPGHIAAFTDRGKAILRARVEEHLVRDMVLVRAPRYPAYLYGDELEVEEKLETPPVFEDFSYRNYLARRGIHGMVGWPKIRLVSRGGGSPLYRALLVVKARIQATIARILPEPEASLLTGILLGVESGIPERSLGSTKGKQGRLGVGFRVALRYEHRRVMDGSS